MVKRFLEALNQICIDYPLRYKFVFVPNLGIAQELLRSLTQLGDGVLNLHVTTISALASEHIGVLLNAKQLQMVETPLPEQICLGVIKTLKEEDRLAYFNRLPITPGVGRAIYRSISDLKMAGLTVKELSPEKFVDRMKGEDLALILDGYNQGLMNKHLLDQADVLKLAVDNVSFDPDGLYIVPSHMGLCVLEKQFLNKISKGAYLKLEFDALNRIATVKNEDLEIIQAYGEENEIRAVLRRIIASGRAFDQVAVFYSSREPYVERFADFAEILQIPVTFGEGLDLRSTTSGRLFSGLLEWIKSNFAASILIQLFRDGLIKAEGIPSYHLLAKLLDEAGIRWGRERYKERLGKHLIEIENSLEDEGDKESRKARIRWMLHFCESLFWGLPAVSSTGLVSISQMATWLSRQLKKHTPIRNGRDAEALALLGEVLKKVGSMQPEPLNVLEGIEQLEVLADELRIDVSVPKPGQLHVDSYRNGAWIMREEIFAMGLDAGRFPGQVLEDSILLDIERCDLSEDLLTSQSCIQEKGEAFALLVHNAGHLTLSYACFDVLEHREKLPSSKIIQLYRRAFDEPYLSYTDLKTSLQIVESYIPMDGNSLFHYEEWFGWHREKWGEGVDDLDLRTLVKVVYPHLSAGIDAAKARLSDCFTVYDGQVFSDRELYDPRQNPERIVSATELETLGKCAYKYFLKYILGLKRSPQEADLKTWLDPLRRGSMLHNIFENFYQGLLDHGERPQFNRHKEDLTGLAQQVIHKMKDDLQPSDERIYQAEYRELLTACDVFLHGEEKGASGEVLLLEFPLEGIKLSLSEGEAFTLSGRIDRVDKEPDIYTVWDYKTGSAKRYTTIQPFRGGRLLQHALYAWAFEEYLHTQSLEQTPRVIGGYIFPTVKGEGQRILYQASRDKLVGIIKSLFDIMGQGSFNGTDEVGDCSYCEFDLICRSRPLRNRLNNKTSEGHDQLTDSLKAKSKNMKNVALEAFRKVRSYD